MLQIIENLLRTFDGSQETVRSIKHQPSGRQHWVGAIKGKIGPAVQCPFLETLLPYINDGNSLMKSAEH